MAPQAVVTAIQSILDRCTQGESLKMQKALINASRAAGARAIGEPVGNPMTAKYMAAAHLELTY